ncbi:TnsA endonuclease N-terminal domain-containing protein [Aliiglaciecola sp. M165]|uniref:TnsA endonuclease N-terminal domain-containing protein n=1 Tax=Aliiglaciecola sp. M165 TaxID=2593649 RepID=UPI001181517D|nr:TnsA endonuclease N-terminal domain-containing protein [Aliiglaciecola sp. M165]TRY33981.1 heteromeric transposase endonuclease subunit TnsA [Aliiglaciecola sp. M165]
MKKRKLTKSAVNNIHRFASFKMDDFIEVESTLEFDACFHFEYSAKVLEFESQPIGFEYELDGKIRSYTPDYLARLETLPSTFYEVKLYKKTLSEIFKSEFKAKQVAAEALGGRLELITENNIRVYPLLDNLKILHRYHSAENDLSDQQYQAITILGRVERLSILDLIHRMGQNYREIFPDILSLVALDLLKLDMNMPISTDSIIWCSK